MKLPAPASSGLTSSPGPVQYGLILDRRAEDVGRRPDLPHMSPGGQGGELFPRGPRTARRAKSNPLLGKLRRSSDPKPPRRQGNAARDRCRVPRVHETAGRRRRRTRRLVSGCSCAVFFVVFSLLTRRSRYSDRRLFVTGCLHLLPETGGRHCVRDGASVISASQPTSVAQPREEPSHVGRDIIRVS